MPNGMDYILFYLKLMLKSINDNGRLIFKNTIPYTPDMLSTITHTNIDVVRIAVNTFTNLGLMEKLDDGALFMSEVSKMLGTETDYAQKKREYRQKQNLLSDKTRTKKDNVLQEIDTELEIEKESPYSPPSLNGGNVWLNCIEQSEYKFTAEQIKAIQAWAKYKADKHESISLQQIELTLKQLNDLVITKQNIVYLIENSISRGYKGIMEPTNHSMNVTQAPKLKYLGTDYIIPETPQQKRELCNYLERCYLLKGVDPRTCNPLTEEQITLIRKHLKRRKSLGLTQYDYIFQHEVLTGVCLLEQVIDK
ncbi:MAG: hypothetical protein K0R14_1958 [Burkholderiales bacterium]|jgi:predicted phage replisome organizer|nr:hypothetical protein [Burkholderiales bacterium]